MARTVAEHVVAQLEAWGVEFVFGVAGDTIIPVLEALRKRRQVRFIGARHEESAALMASAYAKLTGKIGVCMAEAGPGSVHLLNGVYDAHLDRVPLLALTGESLTRQRGTHWPQTINQDMLFEQATCFNHTLANPDQLSDVLFQALRRAEVEADASRLGLPVDLQAQSAPGPIRRRPSFLNVTPAPDPQAIRAAAELLNGASCPLFLVGQGARRAAADVVRLADYISAGIIHTIPAMGIIPPDHPYNLGVIGNFGTTAAADALAQADVVLIIGSTWWQPDYVPDARFIQVDSKPGHLGLVFPTDIGLPGSAEHIVPQLAAAVKPQSRDGWRRLLGDLKQSWDHALADGTAGVARPVSLLHGDGLHNGATGGAEQVAAAVRPQAIARAIQRRLHGAVLCLDVGDNTFWMSSQLQAPDYHVLVSGHWRTMGFGLPAAIAAALAEPGRPVIAVVGDGGFTMTMAELTTAVALKLPLCIVVMNNGALAEEGHRQIRMGLQPFGIRLHNPDFAAYARACGAEGVAVSDVEQLEQLLPQAISPDNRGPVLFDVHTRALMPLEPKARGTLRPVPPPLAGAAKLL